MEQRGTALCLLGSLSHKPSNSTIGSQRPAAQALYADVFAVLDATQVDKVSVPSYIKDGTVAYHVVQRYVDSAEFNHELLSRYTSIGGSFLSPIVGSRGRHGFFLQDLQHCYQLVRDFERDTKVSFRYMAFFNLFVNWLGRPPVLPSLEKADPQAIWIPDGGDYNGLNDRMAIVPRRWAHVYFNRWARILDGSLLSTLEQQSKLGRNPDLNARWFLRVSLRQAQAPVRRFSPVSAVVCRFPSEIQLCNQRQVWPSGRPLVLGAGHDAFQAHMNLISGDSFECEAEAFEAHINAARLHSGKNIWHFTTEAPRPPTLSQEGCFDSAEQKSLCCEATNDGDVEGCPWDDAKTFARCCPGDRTGFWIVPRVFQKELHKHVAIGRLNSAHVGRLSKIFNPLTSPPILLLSSWQALCYYDNFIAHASKVKLLNHVIVFTLDQESLAWCERSRVSATSDSVSCVDLSDISPSGMGVPSASSIATKVDNEDFYLWLVWMRPVILLQAMQFAPQGLLMLDSDVVLRSGNIVAWMQKHLEPGRFLVTGSDLWETCNMGSVFATPESIPWIRRWLQQYNATTSKGYQEDDQLSFNRFLAKSRKLQEGVQLMPLSIMGQCGEYGEVATHYNCKLDKTGSMRLQGDWIPADPRCHK